MDCPKCGSMIRFKLKDVSGSDPKLQCPTCHVTIGVDNDELKSGLKDSNRLLNGFQKSLKNTLK